MKITIEGCDGTGKTTLAKLLSDKYGLDICHCTSEDPKDFDFYKQTARKENVIWDRHTIGELIYPKIFGRKQQISSEDARIILHEARSTGAKVVVLTCDLDVMKNRIMSRGNEDWRIVDNLEEIDAKFKFYAEQFNIPVIDTGKMSFQQIFDLIEKED